MDAAALKLVDLSSAARSAPAPAFPYGLGRTGVHEVAGADYGDTAAALGFALVAGARATTGAIAWVGEARLARDRGALSGPGLCALGLDPGRVLLVEARRTRDALWSVEEAMKSGAVGLVLGDVSQADFTATRRLALASQARGVPAILVMPHGRAGASAASARWRVRAHPSAPNRHDPGAPGHIRWRAVLERARTAPGAVGHIHDMELDDETLSLRLVSRLAAGPAAPDETRPRQGEDASPLRRTG